MIRNQPFSGLTPSTSVLCAVIGLCTCSLKAAAAMAPRQDGANPEPRRVEVDLRRWAARWEDDRPNVAFAADGQHICVWLEGVQIGPVDFQVFDVTGKMVGGAKETSYLDLVREFPMIAWRWRCAAFVKDANYADSEAFSFNADFSQGLRVVVSTNGPCPVVAEMWKLGEPERKLWDQTLGNLWAAASLRGAKPIGRFSDWTSGSAFIEINVRSCAELDSRTGALRRHFTFGPIESDPEIKVRAKELGWPESQADLLDFSAGPIDYDEKRGWIACGSQNDRRVRVFDVVRPEKLLFETYPHAKPVRPKDGNWRVDHVNFLSGGRYLFAEYGFSGGSVRVRRELEIYETSPWRKVWQSADLKLHGVTLAPNGTRMSYVRDGRLVICPFNP